MKHVRLLGLVSSVVAMVGLAGCIFWPKKDPKLVAEIESAFAIQSSEINEPGDAIPWELGQWVVILNTDGKGNRSLDRYQLVSQEGNDYWLELERTAPDRKSRSAMLIKNYDPQNLKNTRVVKLKILNDNGEVIETDFESDNPGQNIMQFALKMASEAANNMIATMQQNETAGASEDVTVPAGTFMNAKKTAVSYQFAFGSGSGFIWYAPVPIVNYVRQTVDVTAMGFAAGTSVSEVADFGMGSIKSVFFPQG